MIKKYVMQIKSLRPSVVSFTTDFKLLMPGCAENKIKNDAPIQIDLLVFLHSHTTHDI